MIRLSRLTMTGKWRTIILIATAVCLTGPSADCASEPVSVAQISPSASAVPSGPAGIPPTGGQPGVGQSASPSPNATSGSGAPSVGIPRAGDAATGGAGTYSYDPSGRRDPFRQVGLEQEAPSEVNPNLPPLQRVGLTELNLIGIVWGGFGYSAMVQTPDGKGYTVKPGTRIGPNNGVVTAITENAVIVQERFADVYGNKQVREYVKRLHTKEGPE